MIEARQVETDMFEVQLNDGVPATAPAFSASADSRSGQLVDVFRWEIDGFSKLVSPSPVDRSSVEGVAEAEERASASATASVPSGAPVGFKEPSRTLLFPKKLENEKGFVYSAPFISGGAPWRVMLFPNGNSVEYLSVYVDLADAQILSSIRSRQGRQGAVFQFTVVNQRNSAESVCKAADHRFDRREDDWGFTQVRIQQKA